MNNVEEADLLSLLINLESRQMRKKLEMKILSI